MGSSSLFSVYLRLQTYTDHHYYVTRYTQLLISSSVHLPLVSTILLEVDLYELSKPTAVVIGNRHSIPKCLHAEENQLNQTEKHCLRVDLTQNM